MRRISANYIFPVNHTPLKNGIIELNDQGKITDIIDTRGKLTESRNLEFYNGIITPGFINAHCHLELSYLKDVVSKNIGLPGFLAEIVHHKKESDLEKISGAMFKLDRAMKNQGIVAVGDISNTKNSIQVKIESEIYYHTFIELIGLGDNYNEIFGYSLDLLAEYLRNDLRASLVPHAPYSVSEKLLKRIKKYAEENGAILSIHNQESEEEGDMFLNKKGDLVTTLQKIGVDLTKWVPSGKSSIASILPLLPRYNNIMFVHNTFTTLKDVELVNSLVDNAYWCLCPLSNLYLENTLPDFNLFKTLDTNVILGTDSLASNQSLSILEEMKTITEKQPGVAFEKLLKWATLNGSEALQIRNIYGSLEVGKSPGINLISHFDFSKMQLTTKSTVKVLA